MFNLISTFFLLIKKLRNPITRKVKKRVSYYSTEGQITHQLQSYYVDYFRYSKHDKR
jgi:hypothetical protein